jgi:hypothetical protein
MLAFNERGLAKDAMGHYEGALQDYLEALKFKVYPLFPSSSLPLSFSLPRFLSLPIHSHYMLQENDAVVIYNCGSTKAEMCRFREAIQDLGMLGRREE